MNGLPKILKVGFVLVLVLLTLNVFKLWLQVDSLEARFESLSSDVELREHRLATWYVNEFLKPVRGVYVSYCADRQLSIIFDGGSSYYVRYIAISLSSHGTIYRSSYDAHVPRGQTYTYDISLGQLSVIPESGQTIEIFVFIGSEPYGGTSEQYSFIYTRQLDDRDFCYPGGT